MSAKICAAMNIKNNPLFTFFILFLFFSLKSNLCNGADTISANQSISGDHTIVSAGGVFELGFFTPGNSSNFYIGIWYKQVPLQSVVWVANRERPISDKNSSKLTILNGDLVLLNESQIPVWSTNLNFATSNPVEAVLHDTGNFVLSDRSNSSEPLWQSFDDPTDSWLPGSKLGLNRTSKKNQVYTSWKNVEDPAPGLFSIEVEPKGTARYFLLWNMSVRYYTSAAWNGHSFNLTPLRWMHTINITYVSNKNETYFIYSIQNRSLVSSRFVIGVSGQVTMMTWFNNQWRRSFWAQPANCEVYALCGTFSSCSENSMPICNCLKGYEPKSMKDWNLEDHSGGCVRKTPFQCGNDSSAIGERDRFLAISSVKLPEYPQTVNAGSATQCESTCLNNCSCTAYASDSNGCSLWFEELLNLRQLTQDDNSGETLYIRLAASEFPSSNNNRGRFIGIAVGLVAGIVALLGLVLVVFWRWRRSVRAVEAVGSSLVPFGFRDLQNATKNFSEKLGGGSFGFVFKETLPDSTVIAVKKLEGISQGEKQFRTEVSTIGTIQHVNLVRLRGFCSEGTKKLLVYDYMPNGSLHSHLFHENDSKILDWKRRHQITMGIARGLVYLHEKCRECIIHCDIKPENILLDAEFCPKVADFGLAKLIGRDFSRVLTTMRGTRGYLAPEWISGVAITTKIDVYSYGMMLFEIISGRKNLEQSEDGLTMFFPTFAATIITGGGDILGLLDHRLVRNADVEELTRACKVCLWCIQDNETDRPSMSQVIQGLEGISEVKVPPIPRYLNMLVGNGEHMVNFVQ